MKWQYFPQRAINNFFWWNDEQLPKSTKQHFVFDFAAYALFDNQLAWIWRRNWWGRRREGTVEEARRTDEDESLQYFHSERARSRTSLEHGSKFGGRYHWSRFRRAIEGNIRQVKDRRVMTNTFKALGAESDKENQTEENVIEFNGGSITKRNGKWVLCSHRRNLRELMSRTPESYNAKKKHQIRLYEKPALKLKFYAGEAQLPFGLGMRRAVCMTDAKVGKYWKLVLASQKISWKLPFNLNPYPVCRAAVGECPKW